MRRSSRLFEIIQLLRTATRPMTARAIADVLEVSLRTVYRDMVSLQAMRVPIAGEAGIGYIMRPGFDLPPLTFTAEELEAIVVGLSLLGRTGDTGLQAAASRVTGKLATALPQTGRAIGSIPLHVSSWSAIPVASVGVAVIRDAIREEHKLDLRYRDAAGQTSARTVWPIALVYYVDSIVLAAWCEHRADFRHFRLDRIEDCAPTGAVFKGAGARLRDEWSLRSTALPHPQGQAPV